MKPTRSIPTRPTCPLDRRARIAPSAPRGFTMVELMLVVLIITFLISMLIYGLKRIGNSSRVQQTQTTLSNLKSMMEEYRLASGMKTQPTGWWWKESIGGAVLNGGNQIGANYNLLQLDFWNAPYRNYNLANPSHGAPVVATDPGDPMLAPGLVVEDLATGDRSGSVAVKNSQVAMGMLLSVSNNRSLLNGLPGSLRFFPAIALSGLSYVSGPSYVIDNEKIYKFIGTPTATPGPVTGGNWTTNIGNAPSMLMDGFRNPIIFVPSSGIIVKIKGTNTTIVAPDGRPFWASAGPDGDFSKGDDNIYSFEN